MKENVKNTLLGVLLSFLKWLFGVGKEHIDKAIDKSDATDQVERSDLTNLSPKNTGFDPSSDAVYRGNKK